MGAKGAVGPYKASWALENLTEVQDAAICASRKACLPYAVKICDLDEAYGLLGVNKNKLAGRLFVRWGLLSWMSSK